MLYLLLPWSFPLFLTLSVSLPLLPLQDIVKGILLSVRYLAANGGDPEDIADLKSKATRLAKRLEVVQAELKGAEDNAGEE